MRRLIKVLMVLAMTLAGVSVAGSAAARAPMQVSLDGVGQTGGWESAYVSGTVICPSGATDVALTVVLTQGELSGQATTSDLVCDGTRHPFEVSVWSFDQYDPGRAWVAASLTASTAAGSAYPVAEDANRVWLRPRASLRVRWPAVLNTDGTITLTMLAICRRPEFEVDDIYVQAIRSDSLVTANTGEVPCDGRWHRYRVVLEPEAGAPFTAGRLELSVQMDVWSATEGDAFGGAGWFGLIRVRAR